MRVQLEYLIYFMRMFGCCSQIAPLLILVHIVLLDNVLVDNAQCSLFSCFLSLKN